MGGLVRGRGRALQPLGGQVRVLGLGVLAGRRQTLARGRDAVLPRRRTLETHGGGLQRLPAARRLLLGLEKSLVSPLGDWSFVRPWEHRREQESALGS